MEVFHCVGPVGDEIPLYVGNCFAEERPQKTQVCKRVLAAWAMGAPAFTYPEVGKASYKTCRYLHFLRLSITFLVIF